MGDNVTVWDRPRLNENKEKRQELKERWYDTPRGDVLVSVTTFLKAVPAKGLDIWLKNKDLDGLIGWLLANRESIGQKFPVDYQDPEFAGKYVLPDDMLGKMVKGLRFYDNTSAEQGNIVHRYFEERLLGREPTYINDEWMKVLSGCFEKFAAEYDFEVIAIEPQLMNYSIGYAGSADAILNLRNKVTGGPWKKTVIDWKSGSGIYGSVARQCLAYRKCRHMLDPVTGEEVEAPETEASLGVWLRPHGFAAKPLRDDERVWKEVYAAFLMHQGTTGRAEWQLVGQAENSQPIKSKGKDWPALPTEEN